VKKISKHKKVVELTEVNKIKHIRVYLSYGYNLSKNLQKQGKLHQAEAQIRKMLKLAFEECGRNSANTGYGLYLLSHNLLLQNRMIEAEMIIHESIEMMERAGTPIGSTFDLEPKRLYLQILLVKKKYEAVCQLADNIRDSKYVDFNNRHKFFLVNADYILALIKAGQLDGAMEIIDIYFNHFDLTF